MSSLYIARVKLKIYGIIFNIGMWIVDHPKMGSQKFRVKVLNGLVSIIQKEQMLLDRFA